MIFDYVKGAEDTMRHNAKEARRQAAELIVRAEAFEKSADELRHGIEQNAKYAKLTEAKSKHG